jgi:hypothetical protein
MQAHNEGPHNFRAAIEALMRVIKHPFPAGKLPVRGLFRVTNMLIGSALMCNVRSIARFEKARRVAKKTQTEAQEASGVSFFASLITSLTGFFRPHPWRLSCFSC